MNRGALGTRLGGRDNALNFLRLALATLVIVGHTWPIGGFGASRGEQVAGLAVGGFFALSGYLIAGSRMKLGWVRFLWHRAVRIMPGFWVCLVVVAFVWSPLLSATTGETWHASSAAHFVTANGALEINQWGIEDTLGSVPYADVWNGSLWTLEYEVWAYLGAALLLTVPLVRRTSATALPVVALLASLALPIAQGPLGITQVFVLDALRLGAFFAAGMALWALRDRLPSSPWIAGISAVVVAATVLMDSPWGTGLSCLPLGYLLLWLGGRLPIRIGVDHDLSYGVYIYAFPVQQTLAATGAPQTLGFVGMVVAAFVLTLPLAWLSWVLVERPSLRLKNVGPRPVRIPVRQGISA